LQPLLPRRLLHLSIDLRVPLTVKRSILRKGKTGCHLLQVTAVAKKRKKSAVNELDRQGLCLTGDQMTLTFETPARKTSSLNINTYMEEPKDAVAMQVQMASLPDGTNYTQQTVLNATAKQLVVTTTNSKYQKLGAY
jgi:hypothetical protein